MPTAYVSAGNPEVTEPALNALIEGWASLEAVAEGHARCAHDSGGIGNGGPTKLDARHEGHCREVIGRVIVAERREMGREMGRGAGKRR
jgi:hypothetical protein